MRPSARPRPRPAEQSRAQPADLTCTLLLGRVSASPPNPLSAESLRERGASLPPSPKQSFPSPWKLPFPSGKRGPRGSPSQARGAREGKGWGSCERLKWPSAGRETRMGESPSLDSYLGPRASEVPLGMVVGGSLSSGLVVNLNPQLSIEHLAVGRYVVIQGASGSRFFGLVTDIALDAINPDLVRQPPPAGDAFAAEVYSGGLAFGALKITPMLVLHPGEDEPRPVKTVPAHFTAVFEATGRDVERVFGREDRDHFFLGTPLDMEQVHIHLDLQSLVERSSGVFGKSGTGKSFITRTLLAGVIRSRLASVLIFDMHNDYGWTVRGEAEREFKGLRQLFSDGSVSVVTLDPQTSAARNSKIDRVLQIGYDQIEPEDVELLAGLLGLSDVQIGALYWLRRRLGKAWISQLPPQ